MGTLGTADWQSLSGTAMTGTHGGALTIKSIHSFVSSYSILKADGSTEKVDRKSNPKLFSALAPSMGTLGIVTELEVDCDPLEYLEAKMISMTFSEVIPMFEHFMKMNKYCRIVIYPSIQQATVWMANPVVQKGDAVTRGARNRKSKDQRKEESTVGFPTMDTSGGISRDIEGLYYIWM